MGDGSTGQSSDVWGGWRSPKVVFIADPSAGGKAYDAPPSLESLAIPYVSGAPGSRWDNGTPRQRNYKRAVRKAELDGRRRD